MIFQLQQHIHGSSSRKEDWNNSDNSNHSQIAISTQRGDFLVEQIKNGSGGEQSTYFLSPINSKSIPTLRRGNNASVDMIGILFLCCILTRYKISVEFNFITANVKHVDAFSLGIYNIWKNSFFKVRLEMTLVLVNLFQPKQCQNMSKYGYDRKLFSLFLTTPGLL